MIYENQEPEINLKNLFFNVFYHLKTMLAVGIIFALLLGGLQGFKFWKAATNPETLQQYEETYQEALTSYEKDTATLTQSLAELEEDIDSQKEYLTDSLLMQMDYHNIYASTLRFYIETDYQIMPGMAYQNTDKVSIILNAYHSALSDNQLLDGIASSLDMEAKYLKELITVTSDLNHLLTVSIYHSDYDEALAIKEAILNYVKGLQPTFSESIEEHTLSVVLDTIGSKVDTTVAARQEAEKVRLTELKDEFNLKEAALETLKEPVKYMPSMSGVFSTAIKWAIVGGVLGAILVAGVVCCLFIFSDKIYSREELQSRSSLKIIGTLAEKEKADPITGWLKKKEGRIISNTDANYDLIAAAIQAYSNGAKSIMVTGSITPDALSEYTSALQQRLDNIQLIPSGDLFKHASAMLNLTTCDSVILVEKCKSSCYKNTAQELKLIADAKKPLLGCLIIE